MVGTPIAITNTHSVGVVRDALVAHAVRRRPRNEDDDTLNDWWSLPVVGETWDGRLNDINGFHVRPEHVFAALEAASAGPVAEGAVGGGTGMICHGFKGGIGTASRVVADAYGGFTIGVLVQANYGSRRRLRVDGLPVGEVLDTERVPLPSGQAPAWSGSIIVVIATDAPILPGQCDRLAQRAALGIGRMGGLGEHTSGDLILAFATGNRGLRPEKRQPPGESVVTLRMLTSAHLNPLFEAVVESTEEAILNALLAAGTVTGRDGITAHGLTTDLLLGALDDARALCAR
jgi:D-aminopeptidase